MCAENSFSWRILEEQLERIISVYEKMNKAMSLGTLTKIRMLAARLASSTPGVMLDAGSGPGYMTEMVRRVDRNREAVLLDPLEPMLAEARRNLGSGPSLHYVQGVMEHLPFRDEAFKVVVTAFSLRDTINPWMSLREIRRVLSRGGAYLLLDLARPGNMLLEGLMKAYLRIIVPLMALVLAPRVWRMYSGLYDTYKAMPPISEITGWLRENYDVVDERKMLLGLVALIFARRKLG